MSDGGVLYRIATFIYWLAMPLVVVLLIIAASELLQFSGKAIYGFFLASIVYVFAWGVRYVLSTKANHPAYDVYKKWKQRKTVK